MLQDLSVDFWVYSVGKSIESCALAQSHAILFSHVVAKLVDNSFSKACSISFPGEKWNQGKGQEKG
jgi:hypothetical protein